MLVLLDPLSQQSTVDLADPTLPLCRELLPQRVHAFLSKYTLFAPKFDLLEVASMSLCTVDLVVEDDIDLTHSLVNSKTDGAGVLKAITVLTLCSHLSRTHLSRLTSLNSVSPAHFCSKLPAQLSLVFRILHKYLKYIS